MEATALRDAPADARAAIAADLAKLVAALGASKGGRA